MDDLLDEGATWGALGEALVHSVFFLISKHNVDSGAKGQRHILLEDLGRVGGGPEEQEIAFSLSLIFLSK